MRSRLSSVSMAVPCARSSSVSSTNQLSRLINRDTVPRGIKGSSLSFQTSAISLDIFFKKLNGSSSYFSGNFFGEKLLSVKNLKNLKNYQIKSGFKWRFFKLMDILMDALNEFE